MYLFLSQMKHMFGPKSIYTLCNFLQEISQSFVLENICGTVKCSDNNNQIVEYNAPSNDYEAEINIHCCSPIQRIVSNIPGVQVHENTPGQIMHKPKEKSAAETWLSAFFSLYDRVA